MFRWACQASSAQHTALLSAEGRIRSLRLVARNLVKVLVIHVEQLLLFLNVERGICSAAV